MTNKHTFPKNECEKGDGWRRRKTFDDNIFDLIFDCAVMRLRSTPQKTMKFVSFFLFSFFRVTNSLIVVRPSVGVAAAVAVEVGVAIGVAVAHNLHRY